MTPYSDNRLIQSNETSSSVNPQVKIVKNQSESRVKLDSEDNKTIQEEKVPFKKLEVTLSRGHKQTKRRYRKRRKNNRADGHKSTRNLNSNIQPKDKISELKCDNSKIQVNRPASLCSQNNNMQPDQNTEKMSEKKVMQSDLLAS